ncbi:hypothetical protein FJZ20_00665 [Candidatus Pacearchaeota archaeon]|nr:hypothetical protein [Candidatus Pacearchaeota archaeon]
MGENTREKIAKLPPEKREKFARNLEAALHDRAWFAYYNLDYTHFDIDKIREILLREGYH